MAEREQCDWCGGEHPDGACRRPALQGDEREIFRAAFAAQSLTVPLEQVCADAGTRAVEIWRLHLKSDTPSLLKDPNG